MQLSVRSRPGSIVSAWTKAGIVAGACLGGVYGGIVALPVLPLGFLAGCFIGSITGLIAGTLNGLVLAALARPLRLNQLTWPTRIRAAVITAATLELFLLPAQLLFSRITLTLWLFHVLAPCIASIATGTILGLRLPPAGRVADPHALVSITSVPSGRPYGDEDEWKENHRPF
jgi:hypothetical protein